MKSTRVFKILSIALAAAVVFYFLVQGVRYLTNPYATTRVYTSTTEDAVEASGWLVREEETFRTDAGTLSPTREEGEKVGQGQLIAATYDSPGALEAVAQIQAKRLQLEQLEYALSSYLNPDAALKLDGSISDDIIALRKNLTGGDYTAASGDLSQLKAASAAGPIPPARRSRPRSPPCRTRSTLCRRDSPARPTSPPPGRGPTPPCATDTSPC